MRRISIPLSGGETLIYFKEFIIKIVSFWKIKRSWDWKGNF
jgi:hypothetical protein